MCNIILVSRSEHKKIYNPFSLFRLSIKAVSETYKHHWSHTSDLPHSIQRTLLANWIEDQNDITIDLSDRDKATRRINREWEQLCPISPQTYVDLMMCDALVPSFYYYESHVILRYFTWESKDDVLNLCEECFISKSKFYRKYSANAWLEKGWRFFKNRGHIAVWGSTLFEKIIWNKDMWCALCHCGTFILDILSEDECGTHENFHNVSTFSWDTDSDEEDLGINYMNKLTEFCKIVMGNRVDKAQFEYIKTLEGYDF